MTLDWDGRGPNKPPWSTQPSTLSGIRIEYWLKCDDVLCLGSKVMIAHLICGCMCGLQVKLCDLSLTCVIPEHLNDDSHS